MERIAVLANTKKPGALELARKIVSAFPEECFLCDEDESPSASAVIVLGGDGTMLRAARRFSGAPLLGINFGTIGYMAAVEKDNALYAAERVIKGDYTVEERMMLDISVARGGRITAHTEALNDGVLSRCGRMISLEEYFDGSKVYDFVGDGVIIATPTGSTAYSLSAGGPVAPPDMQVIISTPVCPHSIHIRPLIASADAIIKLVLTSESGNEGVLTADGQNITELLPGDEVVFKRASTSARLICLEKKNFYDILRYKLSGSKGERE